jgi:glycosyltransferase involved in cell wall biosynthesis
MEGVTVHRVSIPEPRTRRPGRGWNRRLRETRQVLRWAWRVAGVVRDINRRRPLHVVETPEYHAQGIFTALDPKGPPVVARLHTPAFVARRTSGVAIGSGPLDTFLAERLEYELARRCRVVTSPSQSMVDVVTRQWSTLPSTAVVPNPVDVEAPAAERGDDPSEPTILYVGRISRLKGVEGLAHAFPSILAAVPDARLRLVGKDHPSGPGRSSMTEHLRSWLRSRGVPETAVRFDGHVDRRCLPHIYSTATVCVVPSLYESFGYTCVEPMAHGRAVVASEVGGIPELVSSGVNGLLVPASSPQELGEAVILLLSDPELRESLAANGREAVSSRLRPDVVCRDMVDVYRSAVALPRRVLLHRERSS